MKNDISRNRKPSPKGRKSGTTRKPDSTSIRIYIHSLDILRELSDKTGDSIVEIVDKLTKYGKTRYGYIAQTNEKSVDKN